MPTNLKLHYAPEVLENCLEPGQIQFAIGNTMALNQHLEMTDGELYNETRRFVLMKFLAWNRTSLVLAYLLDNDFIPGV